MKFRKEHYIILIILFTEFLGWSIIIPFLPLYAQDFGASPVVIGLILMSFALTQFISSPLLGRLSDRIGRKPVLLLAQLSTFFSFIILGYANSIFMVFLSRIVDGLIGSNGSVAKAYLTDITPKKEISEIFGLRGAAFGLAYLVGPALGGILANKYGYALPSFIAAAITFITIVLTFFMLPETVKKQKKAHKFKLIEISSTSQLFIYTLAHALFVCMFSLYAKIQYNMDASGIGFLLTYYGILTIIMRGILLKHFIAKFGEQRLLGVGVVGVMIDYGILIIKNYIMVILGITIFAVAGAFVGTFLQAEIARKTPKRNQGGMMGLINSMDSISNIIMPVLGGFLITLNPILINVVSLLMMGIIIGMRKNGA